MTLVSSIISDAYRETNLIPMGVSPNANQLTEALARLNPLVLLSVGTDVGDELIDLNYGGDYDQSSYIDQWVPDNTRLVLNLSGATTLEADPDPFDGQRLAVVDAAGNLATYNLVVNGNGRKIEGAASVTLSTNSESRQWMYRADTGNWVKIDSLLTSDQMPFPVEFDDYFVTMLASRLNPRYGQQLLPETVQALTRTRNQLRARYRRKHWDIQLDPGLVNHSDIWNFDNFDTGRYWPGGRP